MRPRRLRGKERSRQHPQKTSRTPNHQLRYLSQLQSPPGEAAGLSPVSLANPCPPMRVAALRPVPPHLPHSPQEGSWAQPGAPQNPLCPRQGSWLSPNPQPPTHLPGSSPSASRPGQAVLELQNKQGVTPGKGSTPTFPKSCFTVGCRPPPLPPTPSRPSRACSHPGLARGHGQAVTQRSQGHTGHRRCEREGRDAGGSPEGVVILTAFACHRHLQLQAGFTVVVDGLGCEGRGRLGRGGGSPMGIPCSTSEPPLQPPSTHRCSSSYAPP